MGQAKNRGSFEQRRADAIQREADAVKRREEEHAARLRAQREFEAANPKLAEQRRRSRGRMTSSLLLATMAGAMFVRD